MPVDQRHEAFVDAGLCAVGTRELLAYMGFRPRRGEDCRMRPRPPPPSSPKAIGTSLVSSAVTSTGVRSGRIAACSASACGQVRRR